MSAGPDKTAGVLADSLGRWTLADDGTGASNDNIVTERWK